MVGFFQDLWVRDPKREGKISFTTTGEPINFTKMAGAGNDFVLIDHRRPYLKDYQEFARRICTRRISVGADGIILIEHSSRASIRMRYYNADGSLGEFCANGTRCAARFAFLRGLAPRDLTVETDAGIVAAHVGDAKVTLVLPPPQNFRPDRPLRVGDRTIRGSSILVGVPHYVTFVEDNIWTMDVVTPGRQIRHHPELQPEGSNANFVVVSGRHAIEVRTYERGVEDETLSCGSGVVAAAVVSALFDRVEPPVEVRTRSGILLMVNFSRRDSTIGNVELTGDARVIYESAVTAESLGGFDPTWLRHPTEVASGT
jgi:diaminopimelate epimerase